MSYEIAKCKITVVKRVLNQDLADAYLAEEDKSHYQLCDLFIEGQEFICDDSFHMPKDFPCQGAWADIRTNIISVAAGLDVPWMKQRNTIIAVCNDWFKPVYFRIEKL